MQRGVSMWESIKDVLISQNSWMVLLTIVFLIIIVSIGVAKGWIQINTNKFKVGESDNERRIIRNQIQYSESEIEAFITKLPKTDTFDEWRAKYILEKAYDVFVDAISLNHITDDEIYMETKKSKIWSIIIQYTFNDMYKSDEFKKLVFSKVEDILSHLVAIRQYYENPKNRNK